MDYSYRPRRPKFHPLSYARQKRVRIRYVVLIVLFISTLAGAFLTIRAQRMTFPTASPIIQLLKADEGPLSFRSTDSFRPRPVSMSRLKTQGCVADGLLSEYNPDRERYIGLINRSKCYYLHRAIETWLKPPDFDTAHYVISRIKKKDMVYGMFIAEAINTKAVYFDDYEKRHFDFKEMCREGTANAWGEHTCQPDMGKLEYREYLRYITQKAIDMGIQSFMFGQIYLQHGSGDDPTAKLIKEIRDYAKEKGVDIVIGAQTGAITDPKYLRLFDYIEGGVGIDSEGNIESGPCLSKKGSCWALLWHRDFSSKAKNVLLHLDWTGVTYDDLDIFARMDRPKRSETLRNLYQYFTSRDMGFLMPFFGVLDVNNGGCYGPKKRFYSPDNSYSCQDEDTINSLMTPRKK